MAPAVSDPGAGPNAAPKPKGGSTKKRNLLAEQELRLLSTLVLLLGIGLFLALPFVLSIGSVVCRSCCVTNLQARGRFARLWVKPERRSDSVPTPPIWSGSRVKVSQRRVCGICLVSSSSVAA